MFPPAEEELTAEQLTAVQKFFEWVLHGNRMMRKLKLQGTTFSSDGSIIPIEVTGPPDINCWNKSYDCPRTALISWKAVELGRVDMHANMHDQAVRFQVWIFGLVPSLPGRKSLSE